MDARRLDKVEECLDRAGRTEFMLAYMHESSRFHVASREYRKQLLRVLVNVRIAARLPRWLVRACALIAPHQVYRDSAHPDYLSLAQCLHALDDAPAVAEMMASLVRGSQVCISAPGPRALAGGLTCLLLHSSSRCCLRCRWRLTWWRRMISCSCSRWPATCLTWAAQMLRPVAPTTAAVVVVVAAAAAAAAAQQGIKRPPSPPMWWRCDSCARS